MNVYVRSITVHSLLLYLRPLVEQGVWRNPSCMQLPPKLAASEEEVTQGDLVVASKTEHRDDQVHIAMLANSIFANENISINSGRIVILGSPIGTKKFVEDSCAQKINVWTQLVDSMASLADADAQSVKTARIIDLLFANFNIDEVNVASETIWSSVSKHPPGENSVLLFKQVMICQSQCLGMSTSSVTLSAAYSIEFSTAFIGDLDLMNVSFLISQILVVLGRLPTHKLRGWTG
ncbi:hypothetical protein GJ496_001443 [Pomphorhynchus laevis]|nr:hypothetical protein GJ496_001443 [Pomphorhynchus laevis]